MSPPSTERQPRRVKAAFIGPFAIVLAVVLGAFAAATYFIEMEVRNRSLAERATAVAKLFEQKIDKDTNLMRAILRTMMANPAVGEAFGRRDRRSLARDAGPLFDTLRADHRITHLYFTRPDLVNLLRLHSPGDFGDVIHRTTMLRASEREEAVRGLELGPLGTLTLRLVVPWWQEDKILGYLEIGEEIEHLVAEIRDSLSVDLVVLVDKRFLLQDQWERGLALMNREGDWQRFATHVTVAQTADRLPPALDDTLLARLRRGETVEFEEGGRAKHVAMLPLDDAGGRPIGDLVVLLDTTSLESMFRWSFAAATLLSVLVGTGVLGLFYVALGRVERDYRRQRDLEHQLLKLDTEHQRIIQMEKLSAIGTMVGEVAHQLNNPLVGVMNMAQLADREADDPQRTRELLAEIRRAGKDCRDFILRMLEFSKVSAFASKPTALAPLIEETVLLFRQTENHHMAVDTRLPDEPVTLAVDPILIRHALFNLLLNAAQATAGDGAIVISLERGPRPGTGTAGWVLAVIDHGKGIPPECMDKIFVPFFTTRSDGTGLGLPVVQHVALLHHGQVSVANLPEGGTRFAIWLPENG